MDSQIRDLLEQGDNLFSKRLPLLSYWQEVAEHFYPFRADFTRPMTLSERFCDNLTTSYPIIAQRELVEQVSAMLRPREQVWATVSAGEEEGQDIEVRRYLELVSAVQRNAMYDTASNFVQATKEGDADFMTFGQCVISVTFDARQNALCFQSWHLRDVVWCEGYNGKITSTHMAWKPDAIELNKKFRGNISQKLKDRLAKEKDKYFTVAVRHVVMPSADYQGSKQSNKPWVSIYFEVETGHVLEETYMLHNMYVIPRWKRTSVSQYAYSPATVAALPDSRLLQKLTLSLLEAGEKAVDPPLYAREGFVRMDGVDGSAGGITWVGGDWNGRADDGIGRLFPDSKGIPYGFEIQQDVRAQISQAFYLNKLTLPQMDHKMTAFETGQRIQEYIRSALPLFEPMEVEYNGQLCERTHEVLRNSGAFGSLDDVPQAIRGRDLPFRFKNPLQDMLEKQRSEIFVQSLGLQAQVAQVDPASAQRLNIGEGFKDSLNGMGTPAKWVRSDGEMDAIAQAAQAKQEQADMLGMIQAGGAAAEQVGKGAQALGIGGQV